MEDGDDIIRDFSLSCIFFKKFEQIEEGCSLTLRRMVFKADYNSLRAVMKNISRKLAVCIVLVVLVIEVSAGCAARPFFRPHGNSMGSCKGKIALKDWGKTTFVVDLFRETDGEFKAYISFPYRGIRYQVIEEISFDDGLIHIETSPSSMDFTGKIASDSLKFKGQFENFSGFLKLNMDN